MFERDYLGHKFSRVEAVVDLQYLQSQGLELTVRKIAARWRWEHTRVYRFLKQNATKVQQKCNKSIYENQSVSVADATRMQQGCNKTAVFEKETVLPDNNNNNPLKEKEEKNSKNKSLSGKENSQPLLFPEEIVMSSPPPTPPLKQTKKEREAQARAERYAKSVAAGTNIPPTLEEVEEYIAKRGFTDVDAEYFWNFHGSKGWMIGKNRMKNWHMALATWRKNNTNGNAYNNTRVYPSKDAADRAASDSLAQSYRDFLDGNLPY